MNSPLPVNRCLIADLPGPELDGTWREHLRRHQFGGLCLFRRNVRDPGQLQRLLADLRDVLGEDILIGTDQEGGGVLRVLDVPQVPAPMALGAVNDVALSRRMGEIAARGLRKYGINWNYAPVLDVNSNPANPVIGERSFGSDPEQVARHGVAWALGLESAGVMASVKHFPGHGDTSVDSHLDLPVVNKHRRALERCEWLPFRRAVEAGIGSMMTAHIVYPALDPHHPATLSRPILTGLLRDGWGYDGVVVTDATDMRAIAARYPDGEGAALALIAGADAVLACTHGDLDAQTRQVEAVARALETGRLSPHRVEEALARLTVAVQRFPTTPQPYPSEQLAADEAAVHAAALHAITVLGEPALPRPSDRVLLVVAASAAVGGPYEDHLSGHALAEALAADFPQLIPVVYPPDAPLSVLEPLRSRPADFVIFASTSRWDLDGDELTLAQAAFSARTPHLFLALWNPYHAARLGAPTLVTYGFRAPTLQALRAVLRGAPAQGQLPVALPYPVPGIA